MCWVAGVTVCLGDVVSCCLCDCVVHMTVYLFDEGLDDLFGCMGRGIGATGCQSDG